jgi:hypothetical protein
MSSFQKIYAELNQLTESEIDELLAYLVSKSLYGEELDEEELIEMSYFFEDQIFEAVGEEISDIIEWLGSDEE